MKLIWNNSIKFLSLIIFLQAATNAAVGAEISIDDGAVGSLKDFIEQVRVDVRDRVKNAGDDLPPWLRDIYQQSLNRLGISVWWIQENQLDEHLQ